MSVLIFPSKTSGKSRLTFSIFFDAAIARKEPHACNTDDGFAQPVLLVLESLIDSLVRLDIGGEVGRG